MITTRVLFFLRRIGPYHHARFQALANQVTLIVAETRPGSQEYPWHFQPDAHYNIHSFPLSSNPEQGLRGDLLTKEVDKLVRVHQPTVIVTTGWADAEYHAVVLKSKEKKIPLVLISDSRYEDEPRHWLKEYLKRIIVRSYSAAVVAGVASRNYLTRLGFAPDALFHPWDVVDNGYFESYATENISFSRRPFLSVARFIPKKNLFLLLRSFKHYKENGGQRELILAGSGEQEDAIRHWITENSLEASILLPGFLQYDKLPGYFKNGFCFILPSFSDQWGLVVNEAMASGLPVLISEQCGCVHDLVHKGLNGDVFNPFSEDDLSRKMSNFDTMSQSEWNKMSQSSISIIKEWSVDDFAKALADAGTYAIKKNSQKGIRLLHQLLSR